MSNIYPESFLQVYASTCANVPIFHGCVVVCVCVSISVHLCACARVLSTPASQSNGAAPSGPNTWPRQFDLSREKCAPEGCLCLCVFELETEAMSGKPRRELENLHLLLLPR